MFNRRRENPYFWPYLALCLVFTGNLLPFHWSKALFLVPLLVFILQFRISWRQILASLVASSLLFLLLRFVPNHRPRGAYLSYLDNWFSLHRWIQGQLHSLYPRQMADFISLLVFNGRGSGFRGNFLELGIAHLISISGIHFSALRYLLSRFFRSPNTVRTILLIYWVAIGYSIPGLRVLLGLFLPKSMAPLKKWGLTAILSLPFNLHLYGSISFLLSYGCSLIFIWLSPKARGFKGLVYLLVFGFSTLVLLPLRPHKIYLFSPLNFVVFSPILLALFLYFFIFWWARPMETIHGHLLGFLESSLRGFSWGKLSLSLDWWSFHHSHLALAVFFLILVPLLPRKTN